MQPLPVFGPEDGTTAGRNDSVRSGRQFVYDGRLDVSECRLASLLEVGADRGTEALFEHRVGVKERPSQALRQLSPDRGFTAPRERDKRYGNAK